MLHVPFVSFLSIHLNENEVTLIKFSISSSVKISVRQKNLSGQLIRKTSDKRLTP
jgi:hypothetical protein